MRLLSANDLKVLMKRDVWRAKQATCIFCGIEPGSLYAEFELDGNEELLAQFLGTKAMIRESFKTTQIKMSPHDWLAWAAKVRLSIDSRIVGLIADASRDLSRNVDSNKGHTLTAELPGSSPIDSRERTSLLRVIRALSVMAKLPDRGAAASVEKQLQELGFTGPKDATIRSALSDAHALEPDA